LSRRALAFFVSSRAPTTAAANNSSKDNKRQPPSPAARCLALLLARARFLAMRLMDSLGRKALLARFVPLMAACLLGLAGVFQVLGAQSAGAQSTGGAAALAAGPLGAAMLAKLPVWVPGAAALMCLSLYGVAFNLSLGPVPNILTAELFPARCRSAAMAASLGAQFLANTAVGLLFPVLRHRFGPTKVFAGFAGVCAVTWAGAARFVPETKGRALEDMAR
jgi:hypothetical protein